MSRHLAYNPGRDSVEYLQAITCGARAQHILDQLLISLRAETGRANHQHHLLIGPRGAGKTHLLRLLTAGRIPADSQLANAFLPVVMPEETTLRSPADLFLKFVERLAELLKEPPTGIAPEPARNARAICVAALAGAKGMRDPLDRLETAATALSSAAEMLERILLAVAENMDQILYLGAKTARKGPQQELWALRRHLQAMPHVFLIAAAPTLFGAVGSPGQAFYDFFREHQLEILSDREVLEVVRLRLEDEAAHPGEDPLRRERVNCLRKSFPRKSQDLVGILAITGGLPRFVHLIYEVLVQTDLQQLIDGLDDFLDEMTPYFQTRIDPRLVPQPEIDLLHTLALARNPQQPTELAAQLYGVGTNEVSELLSRLQERGLVKRVGKPGGKAVTWDLTEPLFRVWAQFRDNPAALEHYHLLAEIVAVVFTLEELEQEKQNLKRGRREDGPRYKIIAIASDMSVKNYFPQSREASDLAPASQMLKGYPGMANTSQPERSLDELRALSGAHPDEASLREQLAKGLFNAFNNAGKAGDAGLSQALLDELRALSGAHPDEASLREQLAKGLFNAFNDAGTAGDAGLSQALLDELRALSAAHPDEASLREPLAMGLVNAFNDAGKAGDAGLSQALLDELRALSGAHPDEASLREQLAKGLFNAFNNAGTAGDAGLSQALLDELRALSGAHPDEASLREPLAKGLFNAFNDAGKAGDAGLSQALLDELRALSAAHPDEASLRERLAKGLFNAFNEAGKAGDAGRTVELLEELVESASRLPDAQAAGEIVVPAAMIFGRLLLVRMRAGDIEAPQESFRTLEAKLPLGLAEVLRPIRLAMDVLIQGEEQALAREPEEMRRVVRVLLSSVEKKLARDAESQ